MATLLVVIAGFLHILIVDSAPTAFSNNIIYFKEYNQQPSPARSPIEKDSIKIPALSSRFPKLDDKRQNWGILINGSLYDENDNSDYNRPINIPRPSASNPLKNTENTETKQSDITPPASNLSLNLKKVLPKLSELSQGLKMTNEEATKNSCDVAHIKCCINNTNVDTCSYARKCMKLENSNMCDSIFLQEAFKRVLGRIYAK